MRSKLGCFIFFMIMMTSQIFAGNAYYVDATNGNDLNDGLSPETAWQTIAKVNSSGLNPGDSILFKRSEIWREQLNIPSSGSSGSYITFGAYGSGNRPIINGADLVTGWTEEGGTPNIWQATLSTKPNIVIFNESIGIKETTIVNLDSLNEWYWTSSVLYVYSISDPDTAYTNPGIEAGQRKRCIYLEGDKNYIKIENLHLKYGNADGVGIWAKGIDTPLYITMDNCEIQGAGSMGIIVFESKHITIKNCTIYDTQIEEGIYIDAESADRTDDITIENCTIYNNTENGIYVHGTTGNGIGTKNVIVRYNYIYGNGHNNNGNGIQITDVNGCDLYYNLFYDNGLHEIDFSGSQNINIYNNSIVTITEWGDGVVRNKGCTTGINIENNIIAASQDDVTLMKVINNGDATIDYNCYYSSGNYNNAWHWNGTDYDSFATWQNGSGKDSNSINSNPLFIDAENDDFQLKPTSPCIDAGTYVGLTQDRVGNPVPYGLEADIGAHEHTPLGAEINASPTSGEVPLTVNFTASATGGTPRYSYSWNFGDDTSSSEQNSFHTYSEAGDYTVTLTVTDSDSNQDSDSLIINASDVIIPLETSFIVSPTSGEVPLTVNFTASATGGTPPYSYSWNFGDDTSSSEQNPFNTYSEAGEYTVTLTVTDSDSNQDSDSLIINASAAIPPLEASFIVSPTSGEVPLTVNFTGNAAGGVLPYSYSWDFGDGTSSSAQNPSHTYSVSGDYTVTLTVTDSQSNQDSDSLTINAYAYVPPVDETAKKGGCFIVTAAYGSPLHPYVKILQDFRDKYLMPIKLGREIVNFYYRYSPFVAELITKHKALKVMVRINLLPFVVFSYSMVHFGRIITGIILVSIFVFQVFLISFLRTKIIKRSRKVL